MITEDVATLKEVQIRTLKTRQKFWENKERLRRNIDQYKEKNPGVLRILSFQLWLRSMDLFQDGSKEATDVRNIVLQETSQGSVGCKEKQQRNYTNGRCR
ncbi:hypothetical protein ElyMa_004900300 [Elysia marginata]|uniref:XRN2-binding (XTBD) domain-containing protein n=1 Tax=Elysia marginata TaxID=1093978 RepID=A0AAV4J010_9GAST|nr:hypothetical protein ElyMa_004900300 [Elysia marginata]